MCKFFNLLLMLYSRQKTCTSLGCNLPITLTNLWYLFYGCSFYRYVVVLQLYKEALYHILDSEKVKRNKMPWILLFRTCCGIVGINLPIESCQPMRLVLVRGMYYIRSLVYTNPICMLVLALSRSRLISPQTKSQINPY